MDDNVFFKILQKFKAERFAVYLPSVRKVYAPSECKNATKYLQKFLELVNWDSNHSIHEIMWQKNLVDSFSTVVKQIPEGFMENAYANNPELARSIDYASQMQDYAKKGELITDSNLQTILEQEAKKERHDGSYAFDNVAFEVVRYACEETHWKEGVSVECAGFTIPYQEFTLQFGHYTERNVMSPLRGVIALFPTEKDYEAFNAKLTDMLTGNGGKQNE